MSKQPQKAYWKSRSYHRHSVERDVSEFMGWQKLTKVLQLAEKIRTSLPQKMLAYLIAVCFAGAFRVNEALVLKKQNFVVKKNGIEVQGAVLSKRWKKKDMIILCRRCGVENEKFEVVCQECGANLIMGGGRKKYVTEKVDMQRATFEFPKRELTSDYILDCLDETEKDFLFLNPFLYKPVTSSWALWHLNGKQNMNNLSLQVGFALWNHRFRSERLTQLGMPREQGGYGFDEGELHAFSNIVETKTLRRYAKKKANYIQKMGLV